MIALPMHFRNVRCLRKSVQRLPHAVDFLPNTRALVTDKTNALVIGDRDNVATTMVELQPGNVGRFLRSGKMMEIPIVEVIPRYHKFALCAIGKDALVFKYGEAIGRALSPIRQGSHVHTHNLVSPGADNL